MIHFHIVTLFPESIEPYLAASILGRAQEKGKIKVSFYNPRDYMPSRKDRVDRRPYGGGPGMVLAPEPCLKAVQAALQMSGFRKSRHEVIFFSPGGKQFDQAMAKKLAKPARLGGNKDIVLICGHYEGVDARVAKILKAKHISVGPYVLTGGELPAATVIDATTRYIPGVLGKEESREDERVASSEVYTRPEVLKWRGKNYRVPKVLLSGNHAEILKWKTK